MAAPLRTVKRRSDFQNGGPADIARRAILPQLRNGRRRTGTLLLRICYLPPFGFARPVQHFGRCRSGMVPT
jgi:hypothetical protein